jgi:hypothetical protein
MPWNDAGIDIKVELSTAGAAIQTVRYDFPFADLDGNGIPDGWAYGSKSSGTPEYNTTNSSGVYAVKCRWTSGKSSSFDMVGPKIPAYVGHSYQVYADLMYFDGTLPPATGGSLGFNQYDKDNNQIWNAIMSTAVPNSDWQQLVDTYTTAAYLQPGCVSVAPVLETQAPGPAGTLCGMQWRNAFVIDIDTAVPDYEWRDITCDVKSLSIRSGREKFTERYDIGALSISVANDDGEYRFADPHPFNLRPGRLIRVTATYEGMTYPLAYTVLDAIHDEFSIEGKQVTMLTGYDVTALAANQATPTIQGNTGYAGGYTFRKSGDRITALLNTFGWPTQLRTVDVGVFEQQRIIASGRSIRDEMGISSDSEGGNIYAERDGHIVYRDRNWTNTDPLVKNVTANFDLARRGSPPPVEDLIETLASAPLVHPMALDTDWNQSRVINQVSLANSGNTARVYANSDSQREYGVKSYQRFDFVNHKSADNDYRGADYLSRYADAILRLNSLSYNLENNSAAIEWTLAAFLNWLIRVRYLHPYQNWGWQIATHIQAIEHSITPSSWHVSLSLDDPISYIDTAITGGAGWDVAAWDTDIWDEIVGSLWSSGALWSNPKSIWGNADATWSEIATWNNVNYMWGD